MCKKSKPISGSCWRQAVITTRQVQGHNNWIRRPTNAACWDWKLCNNFKGERKHCPKAICSACEEEKTLKDPSTYWNPGHAEFNHYLLAGTLRRISPLTHVPLPLGRWGTWNCSLYCNQHQQQESDPTYSSQELFADKSDPSSAAQGKLH